MLTEIEQFIFGGNIAHDILIFSKKGTSILIEELGFPFPIIGAESWLINNSKWYFQFNASDIKWAFTSKWPKKEL